VPENIGLFKLTIKIIPPSSRIITLNIKITLELYFIPIFTNLISHYHLPPREQYFVIKN